MDNQVNEDSSGGPGSPGPSLCGQTSAPKERDDADESESQSDSDEDCDKKETEANTTPISTNQDPSSLTVESESITNLSLCSTSTAEDEADGGGSNKQVSSKRMNSYRLAKVWIKFADDFMTLHIAACIIIIKLNTDAGNGLKSWRMLFVSFNRVWKQNVITILRRSCQKPSRYNYA